MTHKIRAVLKGGYEYVGAKMKEKRLFMQSLEKLYLLMQLLEQTTVDHHKKSVTVGAGLLGRETIESYEWLLKAFLRAHERKAPKIVLTDQDAAITQAVESVLPNSRHRLCMCHIMKKLQAKVTGNLFKNKDFKKRFNKLVWNMHIKPDEFEKKWDLIINKFNLEDK
ncbi:protein FAR-RED IMPAIRED RESPONSE 1-like [Lactuca sativa]|uniref:protein FAR-RED IMPAIRED RESPONSE 1-like n=1 Tax=Lactuca sativa TaxID=4236 RepID=UPI000CD92B02|nr:protein FAR-RED IMPAIRED RESPONSE 1-like [Lactuca sativa]